MWVLIAGVWCAIVTPFEITLLSLGTFRGDKELFVILNIVQTIVALVTLLCVRLAGFRLHTTGQAVVT